MIVVNDKADSFLAGIDDEALERSWEEAHSNTRTARRKAFLRKAPVLAGALLVLAAVSLGIILGIGNNRRNNGTFSAFKEKIAALGTYVVEASTDNAAYVQIGDHVAMYGRLPFSSEELSSYAGDRFTEGPSSDDCSFDVTRYTDCLNSCDCSWYRLKGVRNLQYLLRKDPEGSFSAWEFELFMDFQEGAWQKLFAGNVQKEAEYGYRERLEVLCQVTDDDDVAYIEVLPCSSATGPMPYAEWKAYADEAGTKTIKDRGTITEILKTLKNMKDVPGNVEEILKHQRIFRSEKVKDIVEACYFAGELGPVTRYERNVRLVLSDGSSDLLRYTAVSGAFYYEGQQCIELSGEEMQRINTLLGIDTEWDLPDDFGKREVPDENDPVSEPSGRMSDYSAGGYVTPAGTLIVCVKKGGEAFEEEFISTNQALSQMPVRIRYVKYSRAEQTAALHALSEEMKDPGSETGYSYGISAFGISEVYNKVNVYMADPSEENMSAILAEAEDPDLIQFVFSGKVWIRED